MAIKTPTPQAYKKISVSFLFLIFLGWIILFGWALTLWCFSGFNTAWQSIQALSRQQSTAVREFNDASVTEQLNAWFMTLPTEKITDNVEKANNRIKQELSTLLPEDHSELNTILEDLLICSKRIWLLIRITTHVMFIKLVILLAAIPLFILATTAGLVDGLNQRAIRTASLGRESSYVFHQLNRYFKRGLIILLAFWLAIPVSITPAMLFVPVSILLSLMVSITASRFKKYL